MNGQDLLDYLLDMQKRKYNLKTIPVLIPENRAFRYRGGGDGFVVEQSIIPFTDITTQKASNIDNLGVQLFPEQTVIVLGYVSKIDE